MRWLMGLAFAIVSSAAWAQSAPQMITGGYYNAAPPTFTDKQQVPFQFDVNGKLKVDASITPSATQDVNITEVGGNAVTTTLPTADATVATDIGALGSSTCATDTGSCNLNAKLSRIAERITALIASLGGTGTFGSATPATGAAMGATSDGGLAAGTGALTSLISCNSSVKIDTASSGNVELVALTSGETVYVCGYELIAGGTVSVQFITGTGTACATNEFDETGAMPLVANSGLVSRAPFYTGLSGGAGDAFCIELSGAVQVSGILYYTKY